MSLPSVSHLARGRLLLIKVSCLRLGDAADH